MEYEQINRANDTRDMNENEMIEFTRLVLKRYEYFKANGLRPKGEKREWVGRMIHKKGRTASNWIAKAEGQEPKEKKEREPQKTALKPCYLRPLSKSRNYWRLQKMNVMVEQLQQIAHVITLLKNIEKGEN